MNSTIKKILKKIYFFKGFLLNYPILIFYHIKIPKGLECVGLMHIENKGEIHIGNNVRIRSGISANPIGIGQRTDLRVFRGGELVIGNHVKMSNVGICCAKSITIKDEVMIGGGVCIWDTDFHSINPYIRMELIDCKEVPKTKRIIIEEMAFIGAGSIILKGAIIGKGAVIGAGSVVCGKIPEFEIWAGNPARFVRKMSDLEKKKNV